MWFGLKKCKVQGVVDHKLPNIINHIKRKSSACTALHTEWEIRNAHKILVGNLEFDGGRRAEMCRKENNVFREILSVEYSMYTSSIYCLSNIVHYVR